MERTPSNSRITALLLCLVLLAFSLHADNKEISMPVIKILYDNKAYRKGFEPAWGFSALVKYRGRNILFDTGGDAKILSSNMTAMGCDPKHIEFIMISHDHWDHTGGLSAVIDGGGKLVEGEGFREIVPGVYTTGYLGEAIKEQSLVIDSEKGLIVVTGCAHPGIVEIIKTAKDKLKKPVYCALGGFHLKEKSSGEIRSVIAEFRKLGVAVAGPCHCTGDKAIQAFSDEYGKDFIRVGAGEIIDFGEL